MTTAPEHTTLDGLLGDAARTLFAAQGGGDDGVHRDGDHDAGVHDDGLGPDERTPLLRAVVDAAVRTVPGADEAGVCLLDGRGTLSTVAASDPVIAEIERSQSVLGEGPCLDALTTRDGSACTRVPDLDATDPAPPWRRWAPRIRAAGFAGVMAYPLSGPRFAGALTLYSRVPGALGPDAQMLGGLFADQAAAALHGARRVGGIGAALAGREVLGRAKGILAERYELTDPEAFALLAESARSSGTELREMAGQVVAQAEGRASRAHRSVSALRPVRAASARPESA